MPPYARGRIIPAQFGLFLSFAASRSEVLSARRRQDISKPTCSGRPARLRVLLYTHRNVARHTPRCRVSQVSPRVRLLPSCHRSRLRTCRLLFYAGGKMCVCGAGRSGTEVPLSSVSRNERRLALYLASRAHGRSIRRSTLFHSCSRSFHAASSPFGIRTNLITTGSCMRCELLSSIQQTIVD
jgi:hypothetical protein